MRTSAALSQTHASAHVTNIASQASNARKTDEDSPFAQLMQAVESKDAPAKEVSSKETVKEQKPAQKDAQTAADKPADSKNTATAQESPDQADAAPTQENVTAADVQETNTETTTLDAGDVALLTDAQADPAPVAQPVQPIVPQAVAPAPVLQAAQAANEQTAPESAEAKTATPDNPEPVKATDQADAPILPAAQAALPAEQQAAAAPVQPAQTATTQTASAETPAVQVAAVQAGEKLPKPVADAEPKTESAALEGADAVTAVQPAAHKQAAAEAGKSDEPKVDAAKPDLTQAAALETVIADAAKPASAPAPQAQPAPTTNMAVHGAAAAQPQAASATAPDIAQHVQVSAEAPKPNMPALAVEISARSQTGAKQFDIRLDPPELGRVEVRLSIDATGKASAHLSADQPQTLDLLQKDASVLTRALRDAGLDVSQNSLNFSLRHQNHDGGAHHGHARNASRGINLTATSSIEATPASASWRGDGRLDIRV